MSARSHGSQDPLDLSLTGSTFFNASSGNRPSSRTSSVKARPSSAGGARGGPRGGASFSISAPLANGYTASRISSSQKKHARAGSQNAVLDEYKKTPARKETLSDDFLALFESPQPKVKKPSAALMKTKATSNQRPKKSSGFFPLSARSSSTVCDSDVDGDNVLTSRSTERTNRSSPPMDSEIDTIRSSLTNGPQYMMSGDHLQNNDDFFSQDGDLEGATGTSKYSMGKNRMPVSQDFNDYLQQSKVALENIDRTLEQPREAFVENNSKRRTSSISRDLSQQDSFERNTLHESGSKTRPKPQNLNINTNISIANNKTAQALTPTAKTAFSDIENSYQNIKHKTPVNQVKASPPQSLKNLKSLPSSMNEVKVALPVVGRNVAEDYIKMVNMAATKVQRWYRRALRRSKLGAAALKRLLDQKKKEKEEQKYEEEKLSLQNSSDRKRLREEKARQARQQAIHELQKKREEKRLEVQRKAEEEMDLLKASGRVGHKNVVRKKTVGKRVPPRNQVQRDSDSESEKEGASLQRPVTASSSVERTLDNMFKDNIRSPRNNDLLAIGGAGINEVSPSNGESTSRTVSEALSGATSVTRTTLDDLMETLKILEQDESFPADKDKKKAGGSLSEDDSYLSTENVDKLSIKKDLSGTLTDEKLKNIMSFLDEVDTTERLNEMDQELNKVNEALERPALLVPSADDIAEMEHQAAATAEVTNTVLAQKLELGEKKRTVQMLQKALNQQRELTVRHARETEKEMKKRLNVQKQEYEEAIKRHLSFIDQLIDDKKALGEKCENLVREIKSFDKKYSDKIKSLEEKHGLELQKLKEIQAAAEKLRRERWIDEKTKKIKEMTVKGLEPEIQRLIAKHKSELKKIKQIHEAELLESDERAGGRYVRMTEELRDQLASEKEAACQREREIARQRYEKQLQQEEESYQQQRRRLYTDVAEEKERLAESGKRQRHELDKLQRQLEDSHSNAVDAMKREYEEAREEQERRHHIEIKELSERLRIEKESWEENYMKKQETWLMSKERELKEHVRRDRDKEIELVISRLEEDSATQRDECERAAENRIKRIRDKYEAEMKELERSERHVLEKYNEIKARLTEVEGENERYKVLTRQKDISLEETKQLLEKLHKERDHVSDIIRQEFADKLVGTDEENKRVKHEMAELKSRHRLELERIKLEMEVVHKTKEEEMDAVHGRVKQAIAKKEDVVKQLRSQYEAACKRADHLEGLLEQQRKQLLGRK